MNPKDPVQQLLKPPVLIPSRSGEIRARLASTSSEAQSSYSQETSLRVYGEEHRPRNRRVQHAEIEKGEHPTCYVPTRYIFLRLMRSEMWPKSGVEIIEMHEATNTALRMKENAALSEWMGPHGSSAPDDARWASADGAIG